MFTLILVTVMHGTFHINGFVNQHYCQELKKIIVDSGLESEENVTCVKQSGDK
jgi:hypothetical protein